jgi:hypothetical protein
MTPALIGAIVGAVFGLMGYASLRSIAARLEGFGATPEKRRTAGILRMVALADLILFPIVGYLVGPMIVT